MLYHCFLQIPGCLPFLQLSPTTTVWLLSSTIVTSLLGPWTSPASKDFLPQLQGLHRLLPSLCTYTLSLTNSQPDSLSPLAFCAVPFVRTPLYGFLFMTWLDPLYLGMEAPRDTMFPSHCPAQPCPRGCGTDQPSQHHQNLVSIWVIGTRHWAVSLILHWI